MFAFPQTPQVRIRVTIFEVDLEGTFLGTCDTDFLTLRRIAPGTTRICGMFTGSTVFNSGVDKVVTIRFQSDGSINNRGFYIRLQGQFNMMETQSHEFKYNL